EGLDCVLADMARLPATLWPEPGPPLAKAHAIELGVVGRVHRLALDVRNLAVREKKTFEKVVLEGARRARLCRHAVRRRILPVERRHRPLRGALRHHRGSRAARYGRPASGTGE